MCLCLNWYDCLLFSLLPWLGSYDRSCTYLNMYRGVQGKNSYIWWIKFLKIDVTNLFILVATNKLIFGNFWLFTDLCLGILISLNVCHGEFVIYAKKFSISPCSRPCITFGVSHFKPEIHLKFMNKEIYAYRVIVTGANNWTDMWSACCYHPWQRSTFVWFIQK